MKKILMIALTASMLSSPIFAADEVLATYRGGKIYESEINKHLASDFANQPQLKDKKISDLDANSQEILVRSYIAKKLLDQEAIKLGLEKSDKFQSKLSLIKQQLLQQEIFELKTKNVATPEAIESEYKKLVEQMKGKHDIKASHILVEQEETAKTVSKKLKKGGKFADLAKEYSIDTGSKENGGQLGYFNEGTMVPEFEKKTLALKVGEISEPFKTNFGYHIVKLEEKKPVKIPSKQEAEKFIINKINSSAIEKYISDLQKDADIKLNLKAKEQAEKK